MTQSIKLILDYILLQKILSSQHLVLFLLVLPYLRLKKNRQHIKLEFLKKKHFHYLKKFVSTINLIIGNINKQVAVFDNHILINAVIKIKQNRSEIFVFPKIIIVLIAIL